MDGSGDWIDGFPGLAALPADTRAALVAGARLVDAPAGATLFEPGRPTEDLLLLLEGTIRVRRASETGREVLLYRVRAGESCVLTVACMLAFDDLAAEGVAETDLRAVAIPRALFDDLAARSQHFRAFLFRAYARRIADLFGLIDDIAFRRIDARLAERLLELERAGTVRATHQTLAGELGTAREVISRTLAEFHRRGLIEQARGLLRITGREGLERLARAEA